MFNLIYKLASLFGYHCTLRNSPYAPREVIFTKKYEGRDL